MKKFASLLTLAAVLASCGQKDKTAETTSSSAPAAQVQEVKSLLVYTGRKAKYAKPLFEAFKAETGIEIIAKEGKTAQLAATLIKEGANSQADLFFAQDSANLGSLSAAQLLAPLSKETLAKVDARYASPKGEWIGTSGRARVLVYNKGLVKKEDLPKSMLELTAPKWAGKVAWAPKNASFQAHITAMTKKLGTAKTSQWLATMVKNGAKVYPKNTPIVKAVNAGEVPVGLVNHYYFYKVTKDMKPEQIKSANHFFADGDIGLFVNVSGLAVLKSSKKKEAAAKFVDFLLSKKGQELLRSENFEYPLAAGVEAHSGLKALKEINPVQIDLGDLDKIKETQELLKAVKAL